MYESKQTVGNGTNLGLRIELGDISTLGHRSLAKGLAESLRQGVRGGRLPAGTVLPATRSRAVDLRVSRGVVVRAYEQLVAEGYLHSHTGRGTVVTTLHTTGRAEPPGASRPLVATNPGVPSLGAFPRVEWLRAMEQALRELPDSELGYGDPRGHPRLRQALSTYLGRTRAVVAPADQIVVTSGFAQAARLVAEALVQRGIRTIAVEDPGSIGVIETLRAGGLATRPVPVDDHGLDVGGLAASDLRAVAVTPAHQFPTGAVLGPTRRQELLAWSAERGAVVVEDDYDAEYRYDRSPVGALQGLAPDRVVYGSSASKSLAPGLRLGWVVAPTWLAGTVADLKQWADVAAPVLDQVALAVFIETGALDRHVRRTATRYASRRRRLRTAVDQHLPGWTVTGAAAGLHALLVPSTTVTGAELQQMSEQADDLDVVPLAAYTQLPPARPGLVVGYGGASADQITRGVAAMSESRVGQGGG